MGTKGAGSLPRPRGSRGHGRHRPQSRPGASPAGPRGAAVRHDRRGIAADGTIGQNRALDAIDFGLDVATPGYNLFMAGAAGSGRESTILDCLERAAARRPAPDDLVYAHKFAEPGHPRALRLPAGRGCDLSRDLDELLAGAREEIPRAFEGEEFEARRQQALAEVQRRQEQRGPQACGTRARLSDPADAGGAHQHSRAHGQPLAPEALQRLSEEERAELQRRADELNEIVGASMRQLRRSGQEVGERTRSMARDMARAAIGPRLEELRERWADQPDVLTLLGDIERDVPEHVRDFRPVEGEEGGPQQVAQAQALQREQQLGRYRVNVVIDHGDDEHAPVVLERDPTYYNLIGRVDYRASFGAVETDFRQIRAGALHRASGGFLVLHALDVTRQPFAWEALKRALMAREVRIENLAEQSSPIPTATLRPQPVPFDVKVVLIGPPPLYHMLYAQDEDFRDVFEVKADFAPDTNWTDEHVSNYAAFVSRCVQTDGLHHFDRSAIARIVEHGSRLREHRRKLSTRLRDMSDVVSEASFWASRAGRDVVSRRGHRPRGRRARVPRPPQRPRRARARDRSRRASTTSSALLASAHRRVCPGAAPARPRRLHRRRDGPLGPIRHESITWHSELVFTRPLFLPTDDCQHRLLNQAAALVDAGVLRTTATEVLDAWTPRHSDRRTGWSDHGHGRQGRHQCSSCRRHRLTALQRRRGHVGLRQRLDAGVQAIQQPQHRRDRVGRGVRPVRQHGLVADLLTGLHQPGKPRGRGNAGGLRGVGRARHDCDLTPP